MFKYLVFLIFISKSLENSDVYFTKYINSSSILRLFKILNIDLKENIGIKVHTGEEGGKYYLTPEFLKELYNYLENKNGTYIECNAAYNGSRNSTERHNEYLEKSGWKKNNTRIVIMDEFAHKDSELKVDGTKISINIVGQHLKDFKSTLVITHFKGNNMTGFGGALKHLATGFASQAGKANIYTGGKSKNWNLLHYNELNSSDYIPAMAEAAKSIVDHFTENKTKTDRIGFINVMSNISKYCDCFGALAPEPKIEDIGILASTDPVALDQACLNLIKDCNNSGKGELLEQIKDLEGEKIIENAKELKIGIKEYNRIDIDDDKKLFMV